LHFLTLVYTLVKPHY